ncbi:MAG: response regulator, partial [Candidatus Sumerlaeota bacterium]
EKASRYEPDMFIMDMVMPLMSGLEACETLRSRPGFDQVPVMFLSAHDSRDEIASTYEKGGNLFLSKPVDPQRLVRNVDLFFENEPELKRPKRISIEQINAYEGDERELPREIGGATRVPSTATPENIPRRANAPQKGRPPQRPLEHRVRPAHMPAQGKAPEQSDTTQPRILLVEDDQDLANLMQLGLSEDFEVTTASDGIDGVEKIVKYQPDILLIDVMLPRMNGYQLCQSIRTNKAFHDLPIVFVTAKNSPKDREYARKLGADGFIAKPFEMEELIQTCRKIAARPDFRFRPKKLSFAEIHEENVRKEAALREERERQRGIFERGHNME